MLWLLLSILVVYTQGCAFPQTVTTSVLAESEGELSTFTVADFKLANINGMVCFYITDPNDASNKLLHVEISLVDAWVEFPLIFYYSSFAWNIEKTSKHNCGDGHCIQDSNNKEAREECFLPTICANNLRSDPFFGGSNNDHQAQFFDCHDGTRFSLDCPVSFLKPGVQKSKVFEKIILKGERMFDIYDVDVSTDKIKIMSRLKFQIDYLNGTVIESLFDLNSRAVNSATAFTNVNGLDFVFISNTETSINIPSSRQKLIHLTNNMKDDRVKKKGSLNEFWLRDVSPQGDKTIGEVGEIQCDQNRQNCDYQDNFCSSSEYKSYECVTQSSALQNVVLHEHFNKLPLKMSDDSKIEYEILQNNNFPQDKTPSALKKNLLNTGTITLQVSGTQNIVQEITTVEPECSLLKFDNLENPRGCYNCEDGFIFDVNIHSTSAAGQVVVKALKRGTNIEDRTITILQPVLYITSEPKQFTINALTSVKSNDFDIVIIGNSGACRIDQISFEAFLQDLTFIRTRANVTTFGSGERVDVPLSFENIFDKIGDFFSNLFSGDFFNTLILIVLCLLGLCLLGPIIKVVTTLIKIPTNILGSISQKAHVQQTSIHDF
jgi:hypothetical protein